MATPRNGFIRSRSLGTNTVLRRFPVFVDAKMAYFPGDPVELRSTGEVALVTASSSGNFIGVIDSVGIQGANGEFAPLTFNQPTRGPFLATSQTGLALVNTDPNQLYIAQLDVTASVGLVGSNIAVSAGVPNTQAGVSGYNLAGASLGKSDGAPFRIVGIAPTELINGYGDKPAGCGVEVKPNLTTNAFNNSGGA
jgi:hypothetical protein